MTATGVRSQKSAVRIMGSGLSFSRRRESTATLIRVFLVIAGLMILAGCGGGSGGSTTTTASPAVSLSATSLTFAIPVGTQSVQSVTVTNSGTATLTFSGITVNNSNFSLVPTNTCGTSLGAGGACTISVTFTAPATAGTVTGTLTITDNASNSPQTVALSGTGAVPTVSISPSSLSLTFGSQAVGTSSASQPVTVTNSGTVPLTITSIIASTNFSETNTCPSSSSTLAAGSNCTINVFFTPTGSGTLNGTLTITDNASPSQQTVSLTGTGAATSSVSLSSNGVSITSLTFTGLTLGSTSAPQVVTLTNTGTALLTISSIAVTAGSSDFNQTNTCGASVAIGGSCTINVTFAPSAGGTRNGTLTIIDNAGTQTLALTGSGLSNTVPVSVNFGPNGQSAGVYNGIYTSVTVCAPGSTTNCATVPNVLVDTGSVGLRVLSNLLVTSTGSTITLPQVNDPSTSLPLYECVEYGDLTYTWGPIEMATVQIGGETASQLPNATANSGVPIQVIAAGVTPPEQIYEGPSSSYQAIYNPCLVGPGNTLDTGAQYNDDSVATLQANGILGIGNFPQDCGTNCTTLASTISSTNGPYMVCSGTTCGLQAVSLTDQAWNPVSAFSADNNGVSLQLPSIPVAGQATATGTLTFGIGTETNNAIPGTANVYELDQYGYFGSATFANVNYTSGNSGGTFLDSGSNALFVSDAGTLSTALGASVSDCTVGSTDIGYYCPSSTVSVPLEVAGTNGTSTTVNLSIANALNLFTNTSYATFSNLGGASCTATTGSPCSASTDTWDLGLPFFFGKTIFLGLAGTSVGNVTSTDGYYAF